MSFGAENTDPKAGRLAMATCRVTLRLRLRPWLLTHPELAAGHGIGDAMCGKHVWSLTHNFKPTPYCFLSSVCHSLTPLDCSLSLGLDGN